MLWKFCFVASKIRAVQIRAMENRASRGTPVFYCFFICLDLTIKYNLCCIYHPNSENRFRTFLREASHTFFLLIGSWQKYQNYNSTLKFGEEKLAHYLFWPCVNLFHVVINLCWFFLCQLFSKELRGKRRILLQFFMMQDRKSNRFCSHFSTIL